MQNQIMGMQLITHQTSAEGQKVRRLLIEEGADIKKELYVSLVTDRVSPARGADGIVAKAAWTSKKSLTQQPGKNPLKIAASTRPSVLTDAEAQ